MAAAGPQGSPTTRRGESPTEASIIRIVIPDTGGALPGNAHILSTSAMLIVMETLVENLDTEEIFNAAKKIGRVANKSNVDKPAAMISGGTDWKSAINQTRLKQAIVDRKTRQ